MDAVQAMTGHGGWPMSAFLTPDGRPFYAGTYYPPEPRHGMPSFRQVLTGIAEAWDERRDEIVAQAGKVTASIASVGSLEASNDPLTGEVAREAMQALRPSFDGRWGGFGGAPKFPQPMTLEFCLRQSLRGVPDALEMVVISLDRMAEGGIYDHVGGGFARYSTDGAWHVPHFEKMLYDNAQLVQLYTRTWQVTGEDRYRRVATETVEYLLREMQHPEGGFFSSQDADSEGVEGRFFTWSWEELVDLVGEPVAACFGATVEGNWAGEDGRTNVLWRPIAISAVAREHGLDPTDLETMVEDARTVLFEARARTRAPRHRRQGAHGMERDGDPRAGRSRPCLRRTSLHRGGDALRVVRADAPARPERTTPSLVAERGGRRSRLLRGPCAVRIGVPHPLRDHARPRVVHRRARDGRCDAAAVRRHRTWRLLRDRVGRRRVGDSSQGPAGQRGAQRQLGGGRGAAAPVAPHRGAVATRRRARRRSAWCAT